MGAFLNWDRDDHFAVDHGISGISRKTIRFYDSKTDIGFAAYPVGELFCRFLNFDWASFSGLKRRRDSRQPVPPEEVGQLLSQMPYYEELMAQLPKDRWQSCAQLFSQYQRGFLWVDAEECSRLIEKRYSKLAIQMFAVMEKGLPAAAALSGLTPGALDSPALGESLRSPIPLPPVQYVAIGAKENSQLAESYRVTHLSELLYLDLMHLLLSGGSIQRCSHCGRCFIPEHGYNYRYCNRIAPGDSRTCRQIGAARTRQSKLEGDGILTQYQKAYKRYYARVLKERWTKEQFQSWQETALELRDQAQTLHWPEDDFAARLQKAADEM